MLHLAEAGATNLLGELASVSVPPAVAGEFGRYHPLSSLPAGVVVVSLSAVAAKAAAQWSGAGTVDRGEAEAIALARQLQADLFLTDDERARVLALSLGMNVRGSLGIVLWVAGQQRIDEHEATRLLNMLEQTSLWLSPRVKVAARLALKQIFSQGP